MYKKKSNFLFFCLPPFYCASITHTLYLSHGCDVPVTGVTKIWPLNVRHFVMDRSGLTGTHQTPREPQRVAWLSTKYVRHLTDRARELLGPSPGRRILLTRKLSSVGIKTMRHMIWWIRSCCLQWLHLTNTVAYQLRTWGSPDCLQL